MASSPFDKQTASCNSPHDWLMSLAIDLAAFCVICGGENGTDGHYLAVFSVDVTFGHHFAVTHLPYHPIGVLVVLATPVTTI